MIIKTKILFPSLKPLSDKNLNLFTQVITEHFGNQTLPFLLTFSSQLHTIKLKLHLYLDTPNFRTTIKRVIFSLSLFLSRYSLMSISTLSVKKKHSILSLIMFNEYTLINF
jgi:hypothetical protein